MARKINYKVLLPRLNQASAAVYLILAILAGLLMKNVGYPLTLSHLTQDNLLSDKGAAIVPASKLLINLSIKWVLVGTLVLAALLPLLQVTRWQKSYQKIIKNKISFWRWVDMAIVGMATVAIVSMLYGIHDLFAVKLLALVSGLGLLSMWQMEKARVVNKKANRFYFMVACALLLLPIVFLALSGIATWIIGGIRASWYVYVAFAAWIFAVVALAWNMLNDLRSYKSWRKYEVVERNYLLINLVGRVALAVALIVGLAK